MKKISNRRTTTSTRGIHVPAGGASVNAVRRTASRPGNGPLSSSAAGGANVPASRSGSGPLSSSAAGGASVLASRPLRKTSPLDPLESAINARRKSQTELSDLSKLLADKSARQNALEATGDLHDSAVIAEIGRLQIFTALLPRRIAAKEADEAKAEENLTTATNEFIHKHLGPRVRKLAAQTREKVETELSPHFQDRAALLRAIAQSQQVRSIDALAWTVTSQPARGAIAHAEGALKSWAAADDFEKTLSHESV
jgi:hypothetical protein